MNSATSARPVLLEERSILLDAVDPVGAALDLTEARDARDEHRQATEHERDDAVLTGLGRAVADRGGDELSAGTGADVGEQFLHRVAERTGTGEGGETHERDHSGDDRQHHRERQRTRRANPSATRKRRIESINNRRKRAWRSVSAASSPSSSHVSGTSWRRSSNVFCLRREEAHQHHQPDRG